MITVCGSHRVPALCAIIVSAELKNNSSKCCIGVAVEYYIEEASLRYVFPYPFFLLLYVWLTFLSTSSVMSRFASWGRILRPISSVSAVASSRLMPVCLERQLQIALIASNEWISNTWICFGSLLFENRHLNYLFWVIIVMNCSRVSISTCRESFNIWNNIWGLY